MSAVPLYLCSLVTQVPCLQDIHVPPASNRGPIWWACKYNVFRTHVTKRRQVTQAVTPMVISKPTMESLRSPQSLCRGDGGRPCDYKAPCIIARHDLYAGLEEQTTSNATRIRVPTVILVAPACTSPDHAFSRTTLELCSGVSETS